MPEEAAVKRGRNNRTRGQRFETWLKRDLEADGWTVYQQGGPGRRDLAITKNDITYSVEAKTHTNAPKRRMDEGPTEAEAMKVLDQAYEQASDDQVGIGIIKYTQPNQTRIWVVSFGWPVVVIESYYDFKAFHNTPTIDSR